MESLVTTDRTRNLTNRNTRASFFKKQGSPTVTNRPRVRKSIFNSLQLHNMGPPPKTISKWNQVKKQKQKKKIGLNTSNASFKNSSRTQLLHSLDRLHSKMADSSIFLDRVTIESNVKKTVKIKRMRRTKSLKKLKANTLYNNLKSIRQKKDKALDRRLIRIRKRLGIRGEKITDEIHSFSKLGLKSYSSVIDRKFRKMKMREGAPVLKIKKKRYLKQYTEDFRKHLVDYSKKNMNYYRQADKNNHMVSETNRLKNKVN